VQKPEAPRDPAESRAFRCLVFDLFLERFPHGFITDKTLFIGFHLAGNDIARLTFRNLGSLFLLLAHKSPVYVNNVGIRRGQAAHDTLVPAHPGSVTLSRPWSIPITGKKAHYSFLYIEHCFVWDICSVFGQFRTLRICPLTIAFGTKVLFMSQVNYLKANSGIFDYSYTLIPFELSMGENRLSGKLAVILHADVAGSTELVQQDKKLAHDRIQDSFQRFSDTIEKYQGHVVELRGDALLAEFEHVSDAVSAALSFQSDHAYQISRLKDDLHPTVRVGIAIGEVITADSTVTGAGVVQAQRIEQIADPGGVCVTAAIHEALSKRMPFDLENLGEQVLKGFDDPVRVYRIELSAGQSVPAPEQNNQRGASPKKPNWIIATIVIALVAIGGG